MYDVRTMHAEPKSQRLDLRATPSQVELIDAAAGEIGQDRSSFLLGSAAREAEWILAERTTIRLDPNAWEEFMEFLNAPVRVNPRLRQLMQQTEPPE